MNEEREQRAARICEMVGEGESLRRACEVVGVNRGTFLTWVRENEALANRYARARERGLEIEFEALRDMAAEQPPVTVTGGTDSGWVQWKRLQIDTAKWVLAKKQPQKYGDRVTTTHEVGESVTKIVREIVRGD